MNALALIGLTFFGYLLAYHTYGKFLSEKIFRLNPKAVVPSIQHEDGEDFVPTEKSVIFGHHFTSIAGTGPIVGPAIGVIWGWVPAMVWIFFGSIFMGAVHDFSALVISLRNEGKSISDVTGKYINSRVRTMFFGVVFLGLLIVIAIFGLVISIIFARFPNSVIPIWLEIPIALGLGFAVYKKGGNLKKFTFFAKILMLGTIMIGYWVPLSLPSVFGIPATGIWTILLLTYAYFASTLPVTTLLQPRDYLNAWQLYFVLALLVSGIVASFFMVDLTIPAPALQLSPEGAPPMWPFLFITIACGAVSGFHCLVCSGTSSKQVKNEMDAKFIGYGSMLLEAALATLVIVSVTAGIGLSYLTDSGEVLSGISAWQAHYSSWTSSAGLGSKLDAFVIGASNFIHALGIPMALCIVVMGVFVASFAATTLDSATRIQRYVITELFQNTRFSWLSTKRRAAGFAVLSAAGLAFSSGADGKGALMLWPLFGAVNQLLAALALMVATVYLKKKSGRAWIITGIPCVFMLSMTLWATVIHQLQFFASRNILLSIINLVIGGLAIAMVSETLAVFVFGVKSKPVKAGG
ncbi:MAG: carbon starvation protein [Candidatus Marinamargulisbacteria bacterium]|jgi:carbon starvation protein